MPKLFLAVSVLAFGAIVAGQSQAAVRSGGTNMPQGADHGTSMPCTYCGTRYAPGGYAPGGHAPGGYAPGGHVPNAGGPDGRAPYGHGPVFLNPQPLPPGIVADGRMLRR
jgi:hypothetical protein